MLRQRGIQIQVRDQFAIHHNKRFWIQQRTCIVDRTTRVQDYRLVHIVEVHAKVAAVAKRAPHRVRLVMKIHEDLFDSETGQIFSHITHQRLSQNGQRRLRSIGSQRPKPLAETGREIAHRHDVGEHGAIALRRPARHDGAVYGRRVQGGRNFVLHR